MENNDNLNLMSKELLMKLVGKNIINPSLSNSELKRAYDIIILFFENKVKEDILLLKDKS